MPCFWEAEEGFGLNSRSFLRNVMKKSLNFLGIEEVNEM